MQVQILFIGPTFGIEILILKGLGIACGLTKREMYACNLNPSTHKWYSEKYTGYDPTAKQQIYRGQFPKSVFQIRKCI